MNLYEFEGKQLLAKYGIITPRGVVVRRGDDYSAVYGEFGVREVVVKAQVLSGRRGKNNGIIFCSTNDEVVQACSSLFSSSIRGQYVAAILIEEKLAIREEWYLSIVYNTQTKQPVVLFSEYGGVDVEEVAPEHIRSVHVPIHKDAPDLALIPAGQALLNCFLQEDARQVEINPLVITTDGRVVAVDAKIALDEDAFYRHSDWKRFEPRSMMGRLPTEREVMVKKIDEGEGYYRGTASKYIELDGDIAILFSGGGASIANMDALIKAGLRPANYTEYSGNPPREKVYQLAKIVLSKPGLRGLWIAGGVANFTNIAETFHGIVDALDELKPAYPIVVRRAGPDEIEGMALMKECARRNNLQIYFFGKETSMSITASKLAELIHLA